MPALGRLGAEPLVDLVRRREDGRRGLFIDWRDDCVGVHGEETEYEAVVKLIEGDSSQDKN